MNTTISNINISVGEFVLGQIANSIRFKEYIELMAERDGMIIPDMMSSYVWNEKYIQWMNDRVPEGDEEYDEIINSIDLYRGEDNGEEHY